MCSRRWVHDLGQPGAWLTANMFCEPGRNGTCSRISTQSWRLASASASALGSATIASIDAYGGWLPRKKDVSMSSPRITPGAPSLTIAQSCPGVLRRRLSQPSIHLPRSVYSSGRKTGRACCKRLSLVAKKSSLTASTRPPRPAAARSTRPVNIAAPLGVFCALISPLLDVVARERRVVMLAILVEERTGDPADEPGDRVLHAGDARAAEAEAQKTAERVVVHVADPRRARITGEQLERGAEVRMPREVVVLLADGRRVLVAPAQHVRLDLRELGAQTEIGAKAGADDHEVDVVRGSRRRDAHDVAFHRDRAPRAAGVQAKAGVLLRARERVGRRQLPHLEDLRDEAP